MRFDVVTLFPELVQQVGEFGVVGRGRDSGLLSLHTWNPRDYAKDRHRTVDDRPYGGGPGMVMKADTLCGAIRSAREAAVGGTPVILLSPQGRRLDQHAVRLFAQRPGLILVAGRYEGIDERVVTREVDEEWSLGDYVLSGGELAAMVLVDAVARMIPGVLGDGDSAQQDSHTAGLLDCPHYTRPEVFEGLEVPRVLLSGDHAAIERWRTKQALGRTSMRRPDMLAKLQLTDAQQRLLDEYVAETGESDSGTGF